MKSGGTKSKRMQVLIACESSGAVRDAFIGGGHDAMSCDLLPTEVPGPHYQGDVRDVIDYPWDLLIAHPPCTHISVSGARHFEAKRLDGRQQSGVSFFLALIRWSEHIPRVAVENPVSIMSSLYRQPDQIIQPYEFGEDASKSTCLWLRGLPLLRPTAFAMPRAVGGDVDMFGMPAIPRWSNQTDGGDNKLPPSPGRWKERSRTYPGVAQAMATQWGGL